MTPLRCASGMDLVLCMAGVYRRFREAGYDRPKFLLPWRGATILDHILAGMAGSGAFRTIVLIANQRDVAHRTAIEACLARVGLGAEHLAFTGDTRGQAETATLGLDHRDRLFADGPVAFHNIDTVLMDRDWPAVANALHRLDGWIDVFDASSPAYSYVSLSPEGVVTAMAEKVVISKHATSGFYGFSCGMAYRAAALASAAAGTEFYISDVYRSMLAAGARIGAGGPEDPGKTIILGTPAEYEAAVAAGRG